MPYVITASGPYGPVLALLALVVVLLALRAALLLLRGPCPDRAQLRKRLNGLLFWGLVAAFLGFLGQAAGTHRAVSAILAAREISPRVVAEGFVRSFVPSLFGLATLGFSIVSWGCLRLLARGARIGPILTLVFVAPGLPPLGACTPLQAQERPEALTDGVWSLVAGQDEFLWQFDAGGGQSDAFEAKSDAGEVDLVCIVHNIRDGKLLSDTPCRSAELADGRLRVTMGTGVTVEGELQLERGRIAGRLVYPDGSERPATLPWRPTDTYPMLRPRGPDPAPYRYRAPREGSDGWAVGAAADAGIPPQALEAMVMAVERGEVGVLHSLLVARGGRLVMEEYFHGWGPGDLHHLASCTKSVSSLLVGLAIQEGAIPGVEAPLASFFPEDADAMGAGWESLTLEHLLTMSMALDWSPEEVEDLHGTGPAFFRRVLGRSVSGTPGVDWAYVSANVNLLAGVLQRATGEQAESFAARALFRPLGIETWDWSGLRTDGFNLMDGSLRLLPRDMAKLGELVREGGRWRGRRVVDEAWIRTSTSRHLQAGDGAEGYGYLWWLTNVPGPGGAPVPVVSANGWGSQFILVFSTLDLVVVTTGGNEFNGMHLAVAQALTRYLLPAVRNPVDDLDLDRRGGVATRRLLLAQ